MALENKKSLLQPSSIESQQFRLQFSNLAPTGVVPGTTPAGTSAPVTRTGGLAAPANPAPAASLFVQAPAPVSLAAPPVIPPVVPAPVVVEAPGASEVVINWDGQAMYFDGSTYLTASAATVGDIFTPTNKILSVVGWVKPATEGPWHPKQSIFHMYSGSFQSGSMEVYLTGSHIVAEIKNSGTTYTTPANSPSQFTSGKRVAGNQFGAFRVMVEYSTMGLDSIYFYPTMVGKYFHTFHPDFTISNSTDMVIGQNFSGSLDNLVFLNTSWLAKDTKKYYTEAANPVEILSASGSRLLHYSASSIQDITGSEATRIMEFETVTGTLTSTASYFI